MGATAGGSVYSQTRSKREMWMRLSPPVRMKPSWISPMRRDASFATVGPKKTPLPKEHQPSSSGG